MNRIDRQSEIDFRWMAVPSASGRERVWAALLIALGSALRFLNLGGRQLWLDELVQLARFSQASTLQSILGLKKEIAAAPLDYLVQHGVMQLIGSGEFAARFHAALFGCLALPVFYWICRRTLPAKTALTALFLLSCNPLHHWYSQEGRNYALFFFLTVCSFAALIRAFKAGSFSSWALFSVVSVMNLYTNYLASTILLAQLVYFLLLPRNPKDRAGQKVGPFLDLRWRPFLAASGVAVLAFSPWLVFASESARGRAPNLFLESGLWSRMIKESSGGGYPLSLLMAALFVIGAWSLWEAGRRGTLALLWTWTLVPTVAVLVLLWLRGYPFSARQTLTTLAPLLMGAAIGVGWIRDRVSVPSKRMVETALFVLIGALSLAAIYLHAGKEEADWRGLAAKLTRFEEARRIVAPDIELPLSYLVPTLGRRSMPFERALEVWSACAESSESMILVRSRYMAPGRIAGIEALRESGKIRTTQRLSGFEIYEIECPNVARN